MENKIARSKMSICETGDTIIVSVIKLPSLHQDEYEMMVLFNNDEEYIFRHNDIDTVMKGYHLVCYRMIDKSLKI